VSSINGAGSASDQRSEARKVVGTGECNEQLFKPIETKLQADFAAYLLAELRCAALRTRLLQADIEAVGIALKGGLVTPDQALELLHDVDALRVVGTPPEAAP
jgi:hypothetical protein